MLLGLSGAIVAALAIATVFRKRAYTSTTRNGKSAGSALPAG
jgi:hypothetical protein